MAATTATLQFTNLGSWKQQIRTRKSNQDDQPPTDRALTIRELGDKIGSSRTTIYRWIKAGDFPPGRRFGKCSVRWLESDIDTWMQSREGGESWNA